MDLLRLWRPAGDAISRGIYPASECEPAAEAEEIPDRLRLAIRDGYLNFYRAGQSIANVGFSRGRKLRARIHNKYAYGSDGVGQSCVILTSEGYPDRVSGRLNRYSGPGDLRKWILNANGHGGAEKKFVDEVVAYNPNVIDLEMALPSSSLDPKERKAPRMDLVALEPFGDRWRIVFWEAKLADDSRARCRGDAAPKVVAQLAHYRGWLNYGDHCRTVAKAYRCTCRLLVKFHRLAADVRPEIAPLGRGIVAVAESDILPLVDDKPRLLVDARGGDAGFAANGHLDKLRNAPQNIDVQMVSSRRDMTLNGRA